MEPCRYELRFERLEARAKDHEQQYADADKRIRILEQFSARYDEKYAKIIEMLNEVKADVKILSSRPAKSWDLVVKTVITVLVSGAVGSVITFFIK